MNWNAFDLIKPAIDRTKKRLFPFKFKEWFKLGIIGALSAGGRASGNFSMPNNYGSSDSSSQQSFEEVKTKMREAIGAYWVFGVVFLGIFLIFDLILNYVTSVFSFIFMESVIEKQAKFTFRKNNSKGISLFWFRIVFEFISLIVISALVVPYIYNFMKGNSILDSLGLGYIIFSILFLIIYLLVIWFLQLFVYDFVTAFVYSKNVGFWFGWRQIWKAIGSNKKESFVYWLARLLIGVVVGLIAMAVIIILLLVFVLIGLVIFGIGVLLFYLLGKSAIIIVLGIIIFFILIIVLLLVIMVATVPLGVFNKYFHLLNFEKLTKIKILK